MEKSPRSSKTASALDWIDGDDEPVIEGGNRLIRSDLGQLDRTETRRDRLAPREKDRYHSTRTTSRIGPR